MLVGFSGQVFCQDLSPRMLAEQVEAAAKALQDADFDAPGPYTACSRLSVSGVEIRTTLQVTREGIKLWQIAYPETLTQSIS